MLPVFLLNTGLRGYGLFDLGHDVPQESAVDLYDDRGINDVIEGVVSRDGKFDLVEVGLLLMVNRGRMDKPRSQFRAQLL